MENQIKLVQSPVITHKLQEAGKTVSKRIEELELDKQIATVETVKSLKDLRAELNKELADFETQRKFIKEGVNNPYNEFESIYKVEISEKYKSAIDLLKDKIAFVEDKVKSEKKEAVEVYFNELCVSEKIDFIKFDKLGIEINLSTTEKKYKEQINDYVTKVVDDLNLIKSTDFEAETLTEYKSSLNVSNAITTVKTRKENEKKEEERLKAEQRVNRINFLEKLGMKYVEITNAYEFNADIYVTLSDINKISKDQFTAKYHDCEAKIKDVKSKELAAKPINGSKVPVMESPVTVPAPAPIATPILAPKVESTKEVEPLKKASFEVTATMTQLRALGQYMKENNITYKNI
jgi:hypothetical protein